MAFNSSSQISYLVLDSLLNGSKYGLEIIEFISQKTGGNYILKKPTLYSCLTRMEKKGLVSSSYWGESELGGKRHYYTITDDGKRELEQLSIEFQNITFAEEPAPAPEKTLPNTPSTPSETTKANPVVEFVNTIVENDETSKHNQDKPVFLQQDNFFDIVKPVTKKEESVEEKSDIIENQIDIFSFQATLPQEPAQAQSETLVPPTQDKNSQPTDSSDEEKMKYYQKILEETPQKDDAKFLDSNEKLTPVQQAQNRTIYDTSNDLKKYRKRKSFSENQIEMAMVYENAEEKEIQKERIEQLKQAMLNSRQGNTPADVYRPEQTRISEPKPEEKVFANEIKFEPTKIQPTTDSSPVDAKEAKDDAVFITHRIDASQMPIQKKISPTNIEVNIYDDNLPAPKRNSDLEPTYKDMMAKLFERKKEKTPQPTTPTTAIIEEEPDVQSFTDYNSLKKYYSTHGIEFKEYRKSNVTRHHNTNFLNFINSAILLLLSGIGCSVLYGIISALQLTKNETNFMFYTLPVLFLVYFIYAGIKYKVVPSKKATLTYNAVINWAIALLASIITFVINVMCGMQFETMSSFLTTLLVPIFAILLIFPINYYIKKFIYKKYAK